MLECGNCNALRPVSHQVGRIRGRSSASESVGSENEKGYAMNRVVYVKPDFPRDAFAGTAIYYLRYRVP